MTNEEALKILDTIPTISEQVDALEMAIKALETIPKYKNAYNKGYEAGVKATNVDCGVVWEERIDAIKAEIEKRADDFLSGGSYLYNGAYRDALYWCFDLLDKHCGGDTE